MPTKYKLIAALALAAFVVPVVASAQTSTVAQLQAEIQSLLSQLQSLQQQLVVARGGSTSTAMPTSTSTAAPMPAPWCHSFTGNLSMGMSGAGVIALQGALQKDGESVSSTGMFDSQTAAAVNGFQQKYAAQILAPNGLATGTGYVGISTRTRLNAIFGCTPPSTSTARIFLPPAPPASSTSTNVPPRNGGAPMMPYPPISYTSTSTPPIGPNGQCGLPTAPMVCSIGYHCAFNPMSAGLAAGGTCVPNPTSTSVLPPPMMMNGTSSTSTVMSGCSMVNGHEVCY